MKLDYVSSETVNVVLSLEEAKAICDSFKGEHIPATLKSQLTDNFEQTVYLMETA